MMTIEEFFEWFSRVDLDSEDDYIYGLYEKASRYDTLIEFGVRNWDGFGDAMQSLKDDSNSNR